jgi:HPt (histidine-containing phosphotransfer) domain-containing protein
MYDLETIAKQLGFGVDDVKAIVSVLLQEAEASMQKVEEMFKREAWEQIAVEVHSIKGSAGNMQLTTLSDLSIALETAAQAEDPQQTEVLIHELKSALQQLQQQL